MSPPLFSRVLEWCHGKESRTSGPVEPEESEKFLKVTTTQHNSGSKNQHFLDAPYIDGVEPPWSC